MGTTYRCAGGARSISLKLRLLAATALPILLVIIFSSSPASASSVFLGTATIFSKLDAETCFATCDTHSFESFSTGNASVSSPDSETRSTAVFSTAPSISVRSEADVLPAGGGLGASTYLAEADAEVTIHYFFAAEGPQNITVPIHITANANVSVTGTVADTGFSNFSEARLLLPVANVDLTIEDPGTGTRSAPFSVDETYGLQSNTAYEVLMSIKAVSAVILSDVSDIITVASIDPSFEIDDPAFKSYSIAFSDGLAPAATPIPATLPLFVSGLGGFAYLARRRRRKIAFAA